MTMNARQRPGATNKWLLTGRPGVGKTTLVKRVLERLERDRLAGFYTEEMREGGDRSGFSITCLCGEKGILARKGWSEPPRVGRYGVQLKDLEERILPCLERGIQERKILIIDEIGRMELFSAKFRDTVRAALEAPNPLLATLKLGSDPLVRWICAQDEVSIVEVTRANRDQFAIDLAAHLLARSRW